jgi:tetratricopeptide (TPR) repeat protein
MKRALLIGLFLLLCVVPALAQNPRFAGTPAEQAALRLLDKDDLVRVREDAHEILKQNPDSYAGHYLMGYTLHNSEGDLPQAKFHMKKALDLFIKKHGKSFSIDSPWGWYERSLMEMVQINAEMDLYQEQVDTLDTYMDVSKRLFNTEAPSILVSYAWPLMKLERETEARKKLDKVSHYYDEGTRTTYLNTMGALEMEFGHPQASYSAFKTLIEEVRSNSWTQTATYLRNLGEASAGIGRFDEAERLYSEATRYFSPLTYSNPWFDLAFLYVSQARFPEAVSALQKTHNWRFSVRPFLAQQTWAQDMHVSAELLMHLGETDKALEVAEMITQRPDRQGGDSIQKDQKEAGTWMLYRSLCLAEAARLKESLTWKSGWQWWKAVAYRKKLLNDARFAGIKVRSLASNNERLASSLRPYYAPGTFIMTDWHRPDLVTVYGAGVASEALNEIYQKPPESLEVERPALEVVRAEIAWARGDEDDAIEILKKAIPDVGESRAVLRARAEARLAGILFDEGRFEEAMEVGTRVLDTAPAMFRHLDLSLPVRIEATGDPVSKDIAEAIADSPRFHSDDRGYPIKIRANSDRLSATLLTPEQALLAEVSVPATRKVVKRKKPEGEDEESEDEQEEEEEVLDPPDQLVALFHKKAFAPRLDLSQSEINSLDGSTLTDSRRNNNAREAIGLPTLRPSDRPSEP